MWLIRSRVCCPAHYLMYATPASQSLLHRQNLPPLLASSNFSHDALSLFNTSRFQHYLQLLLATASPSIRFPALQAVYLSALSSKTSAHPLLDYMETVCYGDFHYNDGLAAAPPGRELSHDSHFYGCAALLPAHHVNHVPLLLLTIAGHKTHTSRTRFRFLQNFPSPSTALPMAAPGSVDTLVLQNAFLPKSYQLNLSIDHTKPNFSGSVLIPLLPNARCTEVPSTFTLALHAHKLVVTKASLVLNDSQILLKVTNLRDQKIVSFSTPDIAVSDIADEDLAISISYMGCINTIKTFKDDTYGVFKTNYSDSIEGKSDNFVVATHCQPYGCRTIFPVIDELTLKVPIELTITTSTLFKVVSNAMLAKSTVVDMTENSVYQFKPTPPIAPSIFGFVVGDLQLVECEGTSVPIRAYVTKGDGSSINYALNVAKILLPKFVEVFGEDYPLEKFDLVTLPFLSDGVMENWGMVTIFRNSILMNEGFADDAGKFQIRQLIAHQLTHQWIGNLVTLDDWKYMWLIEAFATWVGNYLLSLARIEPSDGDDYELAKVNALEALMDTDCFLDNPIPSLYEHMNKLNVDFNAKTSTIFEKGAYEKGMVLINMIATLFNLEKDETNFDSFFAGLKKVFEAYKHQNIKPFEFWNVLNQSTSFDVLGFVQTWTRYQGYPLVKVKVINNKIKVEQSRFLFNDNAATAGLENQPFHVPLALSVLTDNGELKNVNLILSDRSMDLEIPPSQLVCLNHKKQFYYKTVYDPSFESILIKRVESNMLSALDLIGIINDYGKILGQPIPTEDSEFFGSAQLTMLIDICEALAGETWTVDYNVLRCALDYLEIINTTFVHFTNYVEFKRWLDGFSSKLFKKLGGWEAIMDVEESYNVAEYQVRNMVLQLASANKEAQGVCKKIFKNFFSSGVSNKFIAKELFTSMFNVTMMSANMNEYKQVLSLAKNSNVSNLKHSNGSIQELQTAAVSSLSFTSKSELLSKTLHFVGNNIDSKLIEFALIGFKYHHDVEAKRMIWAWYKVNYDLWVKRSLRKGSDWSKQIGITVGNITRLVLGEVMQYKKNEAEEFVKQKSKLLPPHQLTDRWQAVEEDNVEKRAIASSYSDVVQKFSM